MSQPAAVPAPPTVDAPATTAPAGFEPKLVTFLCSWCSYAGADKAGVSQLTVPASARAVRFMCTGRMDPQFVVKAFDEGADGVLILGCHPGDCHYKEQNFRAIQRHRLLRRYLAATGVEPARCQFEFVSAAEGEKYARTVTEMVNTLKTLGPRAPLPARGGAQ